MKTSPTFQYLPSALKPEFAVYPDAPIDYQPIDAPVVICCGSMYPWVTPLGNLIRCSSLYVRPGTL